MLSSALPFFALIGASVAQSTPSVVCVAGQCLQGLSNISIGTTLSAQGVSTTLLLLPGQYSSSTNPQLLHNALTSSSAALTPFPGFSNASTVALPLNVALDPGLVTYAQARYSGQPSYNQLSNLNTTGASNISARSLAISSNTWASVTSGSSRVIVWDSIPDFSQLPAASQLGALSINAVQSAACSPPCSGAGVCGASGTCTCPAGFTGSACEACAPGFFGPTCQACPAGCGTCDDGLGGSGRCLSRNVTNAPSSCNCLNGVCGAGGQCSCNAGWTASSNGTQCAQCQPGFFLTATGDCKICKIGCAQCADQSGQCTVCESGFTKSTTDTTACDPPQSVTTAGDACPEGSFSNGSSCAPCSPTCQSCTGALSTECIVCQTGLVLLNGTCVRPDGNGVCPGSTMFADNNKKECDGCPAKCTSCGIASFSVASTPSQLQCSGCLPGFVLSNGQCVESCPSGTFLSADNLTCQACDTSSCGTCVGSATFCLTCTNNQLAFQGKCGTTCPTNTFTAQGACVACHPDCATCTGASFSQCSTCPPSRPVLSSGRCLPTCSKSQFFDPTSATCQNCDSSCSSCSAAGPSACLACANANAVLRGGSCATATCANGSSVVPGLGVCLSDLVAVPQASGTDAPAPLPTISGLTTPTAATPRRALAWWQVLLMALGCAFLALLLLLCWRRRARRARAKRTAVFASAKRLDRKDWRWRLARFGERLFGHGASGRGDAADAAAEAERARMMRLRDIEAARDARDMEKLIGAYEYSRAGSTRSGAPSVHNYFRESSVSGGSERQEEARLSAHSLYTEVTGVARRGPEPRQPVRVCAPDVSRFSASTLGSSAYSTTSRARVLSPVPPVPVPKPTPTPKPTPAEAYAMSVMETASERGRGGDDYWLEPTDTGESRNPFRR